MQGRYTSINVQFSGTQEYMIYFWGSNNFGDISKYFWHLPFWSPCIMEHSSITLVQQFSHQILQACSIAAWHFITPSLNTSSQFKNFCSFNWHLIPCKSSLRWLIAASFIMIILNWLISNYSLRFSENIKGCLPKKKIAEKETLVHSHLTPSLPSLNGTRGMGT